MSCGGWAALGGLGSSCDWTALFTVGCRPDMLGICTTHHGCLNRSTCSYDAPDAYDSDGNSYDSNPYWDHCDCSRLSTNVITTTDAPAWADGFDGFGVVSGTAFVLAATVLGLLLYMAIAKMELSEKMTKKAHLPMGIGLFYSGSSLAFTVLTEGLTQAVFDDSNDASGQDMGPGDFFTSFSQSFIMLLLAVYTVMGAFILKAKGLSIPEIAMYLTYTFCATAGFFTFTLSIVLLCALALVLFIVMSITIRCLKSSWNKEECPEPGDVEGPSVGDHLSEAQGAAVAVVQAAAVAETPGSNHSSTVVTIAVFVVRQLTNTVMGLVNFVMQVGLLSFTVGDLQGLRHEVKEYFVWTFDFSLRMPQLQSLRMPGWLMAQATEVSVLLSNAAEEAGQFLLNYSNLWTPNMSTAFSSIGVFEIMVVAAVFTIVLSDCLLILAPRDGSGEIAKHVAELASRVFLYVVQVMVAVSHVLIFALTFIEPIERPALDSSQEFFNESSEPVAYGVTNCYVGIVLFLSFYILMKLWSGEDGGLQNIAPRLLRKNGVDVEEVTAGKSSPLAFVAAFFGFWPRHVKTALEVEQRSRIFRLGEGDVMLATVNALSFPLYVVPYGAVFAKLGEYMNQCPVYVDGRDLHFADVVLSLTYAAEYALVLCTCGELLESAETSQGYPTAEDALADADDEWILYIAVCWLCLTLVRAAATGIRDHLSSSQQHGPEKQGTGSLGMVSCQSSKGVPKKQGTGSVGIVSCQSSKAGDSSQDVKENAVACMVPPGRCPSGVKEIEPVGSEV